jgi:hypothetical protein
VDELDAAREIAGLQVLKDCGAFGRGPSAHEDVVAATCKKLVCYLETDATICYKRLVCC